MKKCEMQTNNVFLEINFLIAENIKNQLSKTKFL